MRARPLKRLAPLEAEAALRRMKIKDATVRTIDPRVRIVTQWIKPYEESEWRRIRAPKHPILDSDAPRRECEFALIDTLKEVAGAAMACPFRKRSWGTCNAALVTPLMRRPRRKQRIGRPVVLARAA